MAQTAYQKSLYLTYWGRVTPIYKSERSHYWFRQCLVAFSTLSHYLNECWFIVNLTRKWISCVVIIKMIKRITSKKRRFKMSSEKWQPFCPSLNVLTPKFRGHGWYVHGVSLTTRYNRRNEIPQCVWRRVKTSVFDSRCVCKPYCYLYIWLLKNVNISCVMRIFCGRNSLRLKQINENACIWQPFGQHFMNIWRINAQCVKKMRRVNKRCPGDTWRNDNVTITSKRHRNVVLT